MSGGNIILTLENYIPYCEFLFVPEAVIPDPEM